MTEVRLRHELDVASKPLGDVPFGQIETVIPTLKQWGLTTSNDADVDADGLYGQFRHDESGAYFEVVFS